MATPTRTLILLNVKEVLESITTVNGYLNTVDTVSPTIKSVHEVKDGEIPYIGFGTFERERPTHRPFQLIEYLMPLVVVGYVSAVSWADRSAAINNMIDDIITAMYVDPTRDANAITTTLVGQETDEADPDAGPLGVCAVYFDIKYERNTSAS